MLTFLSRRLLTSLPVIVIVSICVFVSMRIIPGDPLDSLYGREEGISLAMREALEHKLGLDKPIFIQYIFWFGRFLTGDWGTSIFKGLNVFDLILQKLPWTFLLVISSMIFAVLISVPLGILTAAKKNSIFDFSIMFFVVSGQSIPNYWFGILLILFLSLKFRLLPSFGSVNPFDNLFDAFRHILMPTMTLGIGMAFSLIRLLRASIIEELQKDYIRTVRAKGGSTRLIFFRHALRNAIIPSVTILGLWFGVSMSGSVVIESIFSWPGIGQLLYQSVLNRDYPVIQGVVLVVSLIVLLANLGVDLLYAILDPRVRFS